MEHMQKQEMPPPLYLSPSAMPVQIINLNPIQYTYNIHKNSYCCYNLIFSMKKKENNWIINIIDHKKSYQIPIEKNVEDISIILTSLGISMRGVYKLNIINGDIDVVTYKYTNIKTMIKKIMDNEMIIQGICYGEL